MDYLASKECIRNGLNEAAENFFIIGLHLRLIKDDEAYKADGYTDIWDFAQKEFGISRSSASRFMAINARFSIEDGQKMDPKYIGMGSSKLQEMLTLSDEDLDKITLETTVKEIRALKEEKLSYYKLPRTVRGKGSLLSTPGCGNGKYNCFLCSRVCNIRMEERKCCTSMDRACSRLNEETFKDMQAGMYSADCQFLHQDELADKRAGSGEPVPCCRECRHKGYCFSSCDVAKKEAGKEASKERGTKKAEPTAADFRAFYDRLEIAPDQSITADGLKLVFNNSGCGYVGFRYEANYKGVSINGKQTISWAALAKGLREVREEKREKEPAQQAPAKPVSKQKQLQEHEDEFIEGFYEELYPSIKELIKKRNLSEIIKILKKEYGDTFSTHRNEGDMVWSCYPDKICFTFKGFGEALQIVWRQMTRKLIQYLDSHPEIEYPPEKPQEPDEETPVETEKSENETAYTAGDVRRLHREYKDDLNQYIDAGCPENMIKKQHMIVDALELLVKQMQEGE